MSIMHGIYSNANNFSSLNAMSQVSWIIFVCVNCFRGDAQAKMGKISNTKGSMQKKLAEMRKKIKQTNQEANSCDVGK